jgi:hypothetical protein
MTGKAQRYSIRRADIRMRDDFSFIGFLKNRGYIDPIAWRLSSEHSVTEIIADLSKATGKTVTATEFWRLLEHHRIY